ncbi:hypothetical protein KUTeg_002544 [Tegillarca granosa]|uniref:Uncharacterized protein n=1 Tax=Tegillarca granosa TaxID=220873 RepID=A0ABQ9FVY6_TEGGR|nr:hypothetical protein KUTeg_002544 [Tegillarca granosa]
MRAVKETPEGEIDEHSYIEPQQSIEHALPVSISSFEEPEPLAYQITNDFPLSPCYDESVIRTKSKGLPVLPKKSTNEPNVTNENPGSSCDINSALRTKTKVPPPVLPKKKNESKLTNLVVPCSSCDINSVLRIKTKGPPPLLPKKKSESKLTNLVVPENVKRKQIVYKKK